MLLPLLKIVIDAMISTEWALFLVVYSLQMVNSFQYIHKKSEAEADLAEGEVQERLLILLCVVDVEEHIDNLFSFC